MSKKKKDKTQGKKSGEYTLITIDENHALEVKNETLLERLRRSAVLIKDAEAVVKELKEKELKQEEWIAYITCDPLPKSHQPAKIREFFSKIFYYESNDVELSYNWQLAQDERSILTQDIDAVDLTGRTLKETKQEFGEIYAKHISDTIAIIKKIHNFVDKPNKAVSERIIKDLQQDDGILDIGLSRLLVHIASLISSKTKLSQNSLLQVIHNAYVYIVFFMDSLTSRVLCSETAYMDQIDATTAQYSFHSDDFDIHIWTFLNVPLYLDPVDTIFKIINLSQIRVKLKIPFSVLCENMVIRGSHSKCDNFSPHARYYTLPGFTEEESNLPRCIKNEWTEQMAIQAEIKNLLVKTRAEFDEMMRLKAEEEEAKARLRKKEDDKGKQQEKKKPKKPPKEPQIVEPNQVPVVRNDFLKRAQEQFERDIEQFNPKTFHLIPGEINLRQYQILGGVYQLQSLEKPIVTNFPQLIMTWYTPKVRIELRDTPQLKGDISDISKFFEIQFELPECYCYWGEPIPCLFEEATTPTSEKDIDPHLTQLNVRTPVIINDFNLHELFTKPMMHDFVENTIPLMISSFKLPEDFRDEEDEKKKGKAALGRSKASAEEKQREAELAMKENMLSFEAQYCPERLFPLFKKVLPVIIMPQPDESHDDATSKIRMHPYETFSELMTALLSIKESYRQSTFKDRFGKPVKIIAETYDRNIRRPNKEAIASKYILEEGDMRKSLMKKAQSFEKHDLLSDSLSRLSEEVEQQVQEVAVKAAPKPKGKGHKHRPSKQKTETVEEVVEEGTFGFAFNRYQHFPFEKWTLQPFEDDPEEVELAIRTENVMFRFYVSPQGYKVCASDFVKFYKNRKIYMEITEPLQDLNELKTRLQEKFLNIFAEPDAAMYVKGYFSVKHFASECHTYECMSLYAQNLKFQSSIWNKLSDRRNMILKFGELRDNEEDMFQLKITPENVQFVDIKELCTELEVISLSYIPTWRNLEWYPDLNHLIIASFNNALDMRMKDPYMLYYLKNLLRAIRPLSYS